MPHIFFVAVNMPSKAPEEPSMIGHHLVIADSLDQILAKYPAAREDKERAHEWITDIRLLASSSSTAAPMHYLDMREQGSHSETNAQGSEAPAQ